MIDGAFYARKCYAQKRYYWVRDQEKIKSNELVITVVIDVLGIYDTKPTILRAVTISHLSDIVGLDGIVFVAVKHKTIGDRFDNLLNLRSNVRYLVGADTTNPSYCKKCLNAGRIDVLNCDVGCTDQVQCLFTRASFILENGDHFVSFIKANNTVVRSNHEVVVPPYSICLSEMNKLQELGFQRSKEIEF